jgi:hypothetical protein
LGGIGNVRRRKRARQVGEREKVVTITAVAI